MSRKDELRKLFIEDTQMFQRIAGTPESSAEELGVEFDKWNRPRREREVESARTHVVIAQEARKTRRN